MLAPVQDNDGSPRIKAPDSPCRTPLVTEHALVSFFFYSLSVYLEFRILPCLNNMLHETHKRVREAHPQVTLVRPQIACASGWHLQKCPGHTDCRKCWCLAAVWADLEGPLCTSPISSGRGVRASGRAAQREGCGWVGALVVVLWIHIELVGAMDLADGGRVA